VGGKSLTWAAGLLLGVASVASAQGVAGVSANVSVPEVMQLRVERGAGDVVTEGVYRESTGAVLLRVKANRDWRLVLTTAAPERVASNGGVGEASAPVWYRTEVVSGSGTGTGSFLEATPAGSVVAAGGRGNEIVIRLDYRWLEGAGDDAPATSLTYTLAPG